MSLEPPDELSKWVGSAVLGAAVAWLSRNLFRGGSEREWRAEVKQDLAKVLEAVHGLTTAQAVTKSELARVDSRMTAIEVRQDEQAKAHREAMAELRAEFHLRIDRMRGGE